jgi:glucose-1-phosphate adenylyltransferase
VFDETDRRGMAVDSLISGGCIISGALVRGSLLYSGVHAHS